MLQIDRNNVDDEGYCRVNVLLHIGELMEEHIRNIERDSEEYNISIIECLISMVYDVYQWGAIDSIEPLYQNSINYIEDRYELDADSKKQEAMELLEDYMAVIGVSYPALKELLMDKRIPLVFSHVEDWKFAQDCLLLELVYEDHNEG